MIPETHSPEPSREEMDAFIEASRLGNIAVVRGFLTNYPSAIDKKDESGRTALMIAVTYKRNNIVTLLLEYDASVNAEDRNKNTPLIMAATFGNMDAVRMLLEKGADISIKNKSNFTAVRSADQCGHRDIGDLIEQWPALQEERRLKQEREQALATDIADFSPALKRPIRVLRPFK